MRGLAFSFQLEYEVAVALACDPLADSCPQIRMDDLAFSWYWGQMVGSGAAGHSSRIRLDLAFLLIHGFWDWGSWGFDTSDLGLGGLASIWGFFLGGLSFKLDPSGPRLFG